MASGQVVRTRPNIGFAFESLTVADSIQVLTPSVYKDSVTSGGADSAFITLASGQIRYRYDGGDPTSTVGHILDIGGILILNGQNQMAAFKCIRTGTTSGVISTTYERE
jgi:hypothetical protein